MNCPTLPNGITGMKYNVNQRLALLCRYSRWVEHRGQWNVPRPCVESIVREPKIIMAASRRLGRRKDAAAVWPSQAIARCGNALTPRPLWRLRRRPIGARMPEGQLAAGPRAFGFMLQLGVLP